MTGGRSASCGDGTLIAAVEAGGTKVRVSIGRAHDRPLVTRRVETSSPAATLAEVAAFIAHSEAELGSVDAVGIASFGPINVRRGTAEWGTMAKTPKPGWTGADVAGAFVRFAGGRVAIDTDVNAAAVAEARWGAGRGLGDLAYVTVGTGLGVGLLLDGATRHGMLHPEAGHTPLRRVPGDMFRGSCPFHGDCAEGLLSGPAIEERLSRKLELANASDEDLEVFTDYLGQLCATVVLMTSVPRIVIGGGVMAELPVHDLVELRMRHWLAGYLPLPEGRPFIVPPGLRDGSGLAGAFALASDLLERPGDVSDRRRVGTTV